VGSALNHIWLSFRRWVARRSAPLGLVIAAVASSAPVFLITLPIAPPKPMLGVVERFGTGESRWGIYLVAVARIGDRRVTVRLPRGHTCTVGGRIRVIEQRRPLGLTYTSDWLPCTP
jgi:hypothetical protein